MTLPQQCWRLFRLHIRMQFSLSVLQRYFRHDRKKLGVFALVTLSVLFGVGSILWVYTTLYRAIVTDAISLGLGPVVLTLSILFAMLATLVLGFIQITAQTLNAKDVEWYAPLPVKPAAVFFAKLGMVYLAELLTTSLVLLPAYWIYALHTPTTVQFWVLAVLSIPLVPIIPLALSSLLALPFARLAALFRRRDLMTYVFTILAIGLMLFVQLYLSRHFGQVMSGDSSQIANLLSNHQDLLRLLGGLFPPALWLSDALTLPLGAALLSFVLLLTVTVVSVFACLWLAQKLYYRGVLAILETPQLSSKRKGYRADTLRVNTPIVTLAVLEVKRVLRTPVYAMNSLTGIIFAFIFALMPLFIGKENMKDITAEFSGFLQNQESISMVFAVTVFFVSFMGMMAVAASATTISREGQGFWICLTIPVSPRHQILAKFYACTFIAVISTLFLVAALMIVMPSAAGLIALSLLPTIVILGATTAISIIPDLLHPKLKWDNEAEAMKSNMNALLGLMLAMIPLLIWGALTVLPLILLLATSITIPLVVTLVVMTALAAGLCYVSVKILTGLAQQHYGRISETLN